MKKYILLLMLFASSLISQAQEISSISKPPSGDNQKASVTQWIGPVSITIIYNSPDVQGPNGEDRKGHIWGELVPYGFIDQGFGSSKAAPWRAGANQNTTINFSHHVKIEGKDIAAGTYGLFLLPEKDKSWTWIFSKNYTSWGSYFYNSDEDALRVEVKPEESLYTEWLTYGFDDRQPTSTLAYLQWENKRIPFKIEVPEINSLYLAKISEELRNYEGFDYRNWSAGALFCVQRKINLDEALTWAETAISLPGIGQEEFNTLQVKAQVLEALGRTAEAEVVMDKAIKHPTANVNSIHQYGKSLLSQGKNKKAFDVFTLNRKMHPDDKFTTYIGLARGYTALGDKKNAIKNWEMAIKNIPSDQKGSLQFYEGELKKLKN